jgi:hypothetical protein
VAYEAEGATATGAAKIAACASCGGGKKVGYIGAGSGNGVTFAQVDAGWTGAHTLFVHGLSADPRGFAIRVNGGAPIALAMQGYDWTTPIVASVQVSLVRGPNTIALSNDNQYAPDLDRIVVW